MQALLAPNIGADENGPDPAVAAAAAAAGVTVAADVELGFTGDSAAGPEAGRPSGEHHLLCCVTHSLLCCVTPLSHAAAAHWCAVLLGSRLLAQHRWLPSLAADALCIAIR